MPRPGLWARLPRLPDGLGEALSLFVVMRVALSLFALFVIGHAASVPTSCHFELALDNWTTIPPVDSSPSEFPWVGVWQRWDACWYSKVATFGYEVGQDSANFWPFLPMAMRLVALPFGGDVALAGLIVVAVAYILAIVGLDRLVTMDWDRDLANRTTLFITIAPAALFLFAPFTEAPFLAATVWAVYGARRRSWWLAAAACLVASLTRIQGVFLVLPVAWEAGLAWRQKLSAASSGDAAISSSADSPPETDPHPAGGRAALASFAARLPSLGSLVAVATPAIGFAAFMVATKALTGVTPLDTQDVWGGKNFHWPWETVAVTLQWIQDRHDSLEALNLVMLVLFVVLVLVGMRKLPVSYSLLAVPQVALIAVRIQPTPLTSTTRLLEVVFPAFVVLAMLLSGRRRQWAWEILSLLALGALTWMWVIGDWVA
jgi:Mannosyltransferase (PIG-V)